MCMGACMGDVSRRDTSDLLTLATRSAEAFHKQGSQLKMVTLDVTEHTPVGIARHLVAIIERTRSALRESEINVRRAELDREEAEDRAAAAVDRITRERAHLDALEAGNRVDSTRAAQRGALRKLTQALREYEAICEQLGVDVITEDMVEENDVTHHLMRAMSQALAAARARGGLIDEGNHIYLQDLGVNGAAAQRELTAYLEAEQNLINEGRVPTFHMQVDFLRRFAERYGPQVHQYVHHRGLLPLIEEALANPKEITDADQCLPLGIGWDRPGERH